MVIDFHTHIWRFIDHRTPPSRQVISPEDLLRAMDRCNVDKAVIFPLAYVSTSPPPLLLDNAYILESVHKYPDRLIGFIAVDPKQSQAVDTVKCYLSEGLAGVKLLPMAHGYVMSNHLILDPVLQVCAEFRVPVFIRAGDEITNTPLQIEEMASSFPTIPAMVIGQMGRKWLMDEALMVAQRNENIYLETSDTNQSEIRAAVKAAGARRVLFASHGELEEMESHLDRHRQAIPDPMSLECVLAGNAARIFRARK